MRQRRKLNNEEGAAQAHLFLQANIDFATKSDDEIMEKWDDTRNQIKKFYIEEYVPSIIKHNDLMIELNKLSFVLLQRKVLNQNQIQQNIEILKNWLAEIMEKNNA